MGAEDFIGDLFRQLGLAGMPIAHIMERLATTDQHDFLGAVADASRNENFTAIFRCVIWLHERMEDWDLVEDLGLSSQKTHQMLIKTWPLSKEMLGHGLAVVHSMMRQPGPAEHNVVEWRKWTPTRMQNMRASEFKVAAELGPFGRGKVSNSNCYDPTAIAMYVRTETRKTNSILEDVRGISVQHPVAKLPDWCIAQLRSNQNDLPNFVQIRWAYIEDQGDDHPWSAFVPPGAPPPPKRQRRSLHQGQDSFVNDDEDESAPPPPPPPHPADERSVKSDDSVEPSEKEPFLASGSESPGSAKSSVASKQLDHSAGGAHDTPPPDDSTPAVPSQSSLPESEEMPCGPLTPLLARLRDQAPPSLVHNVTGLVPYKDMRVDHGHESMEQNLLEAYSRKLISRALITERFPESAKGIIDKHFTVLKDDELYVVQLRVPRTLARNNGGPQYFYPHTVVYEKVIVPCHAKRRTSLACKTCLEPTSRAHDGARTPRPPLDSALKSPRASAGLGGG
jgi:hypothetical protein